MDLMGELLPKVQAYLSGHDWRDIPCMHGRSFEVLPLAQGEYNLNYLITAGSLRLVFRVNIGTQINRKDQVVYEYKAVHVARATRNAQSSAYRRMFDHELAEQDLRAIRDATQYEWALATAPFRRIAEARAARRVTARLPMGPRPRDPEG